MWRSTAWPIGLGVEPEEVRAAQRRAGRCAACPCGEDRGVAALPGASASTSLETWPCRKSAASPPRTANMARPRLRAVDQCRPYSVTQLVLTAPAISCHEWLLLVSPKTCFNTDDYAKAVGSANFRAAAARRRRPPPAPRCPCCTSWSRTRACTAASARPPRPQSSTTRRAHRGSGHLGAVGRVDPAVNGFDPHGDPARLRRGPSCEGGVREWEIVAEDKRDRGGARRQVRRLDLQRPRARARRCAPGGRAPAGALRERLARTRTRCTSTASTAT